MALPANRIARNYRILVSAAICLGALFTTGCDECRAGATRCQGDSLDWCTDDGDGPFASASWNGGKCAVACHTAAGWSACVDSAQPAAACAGAIEDVCFDGTPASCWDGYPIKHGACASGSHCVPSASCGVMCAVDDVPDPRCAAQPFCDGGSALLSCTCDLVVRRDDCGGADLCREIGGESHCIQSATPDPRCGDPGQRLSGFCSDDFAYECWFGFVVGRYKCASNGCLERAQQWAVCNVVAG